MLTDITNKIYRIYFEVHLTILNSEFRNIDKISNINYEKNNFSMNIRYYSKRKNLLYSDKVVWV